MIGAGGLQLQLNLKANYRSFQPQGPRHGRQQEEIMLQTKDAVNSTSIKKAIEGRDGAMLSGFYADDAVVRVIDRNNPPSKPREIRGKASITTFWDDICGRAMSHKIESSVTEGDRLAFTENCAYPDGTKVYCATVVELKNGRIARQTVVQAWDE
jgi:ketosteroid isomerase-like protein